MPSLSTSSPAITAATILLTVARRSIEHGLNHHYRSPDLVLSEYSDNLTQPGASFVSLHIGKQLRGCIGTLKAHQPLIVDVAHNACNAAFRDPRFPPLAAAELTEVDIEISLLSKATRMHYTDEADLLTQLRPGVDGLILQEGEQRGTFLPAVWQSLPRAADFLRELKKKAGLPGDYWSATLQVWRYETTLVRRQ